MKKFQALKGFSLIELLIALIIVSLLFSAFSPVIIKKMQASSVITQKLENNNTLQVENCKENCLLCSKDNDCYICKNGYNLVDNECIEEEAPTKTTVIKEPQSQDECPKDTLFIPSVYSGTTKNLCATKYNTGDEPDEVMTKSDYEALSIEIVNVDNQESCTTGICCFKGTTVTPCTSTGNGDSTYSGCTRTLCTYQAASIICKNWAPKGAPKGSFRLATQQEWQYWSNNFQYLTTNLGSNGLQICEGGNGVTASAGFMLCYYGATNCIGSNGCYGYVYWTSRYENGTAYACHTAGGKCSAFYGYKDKQAFSTRCVTETVEIEVD